MHSECTFSSDDYLQGLSHLGAVSRHPELPFAVLRREIPGTPYVDGVGPWPYRCISSDADILVFQEEFRHLVTLCIVTQPGWSPPVALQRTIDVRLLKQHYVFDPSLPTPALSRRCRRRLAEAERHGTFEVVTAPDEQMVMADLYQDLVRRRGLGGGFFDMPRQHFASIARLRNAAFFRVGDASGDASGDLSGCAVMACGVVIHDDLQILHFVTTARGLTWNASYLMMSALQEYVRHRGLRLLTGGMPAGGSPGLQAFKGRWVNAFLPVHMVCIVNDRAVAAGLAADRGCPSTFFPGYRHAP